MQWEPGARRAVRTDVTQDRRMPAEVLSDPDRAHFERFDTLYRGLCALLFNYVPTSGHPGGSISSGRFTSMLLFDGMDYDLSAPDRPDADVLSYAAGHKAMGLYAMWALRDEIARVGDPSLLPRDERARLRLEDLLGFRRNPITATKRFREERAKALDGHPTPATPFVKLATGASGVGVASSVGLAIGVRDHFGADSPTIHISEGEGGLTPGRVAEALAAAGTARLDNVVLHLDWNQASIDSDRVCRDGETPGDYVQWEPGEFFHLYDWNVVDVPDGHDLRQIASAQRRAAALDNGQPTAIVYRTHKGWKYGVEGRASHGAGHKLCSDGFYEAMAELAGDAQSVLPACDPERRTCLGEGGDQTREECFWSALQFIRRQLEDDDAMVQALAARLRASRERLDRRARKARQGAPNVDAVYEVATGSAAVPEELRLESGSETTLREALGRSLRCLNERSGGALLTASADLLGSTSVNLIGCDFGTGFWNAVDNPQARLLSVGGICEDAISGILSGISAAGFNIGVGSSYGAFMAPLGHIAARLHAIGQQARAGVWGEPYRPMVLICGHAGLKTGEDGPTHADPQPLQLLQENFPPGSAISLTPWEPQEIWPLLTSALARRPALIAPFVTRPTERVLDRVGLGLAPPEAAVSGVYELRRPAGAADVTIVLQESAVTYAFVTGALPLLEREGIDCRVYYVASAELFDLLPAEQRRALFPEEHAFEAVGITGFTLPTMYRWIRSDAGREATLYPFKRGRFLGSGQGEMVLAEAGLDGESQFGAVKEYLDGAARSRRPWGTGADG